MNNVDIENLAEKRAEYKRVKAKMDRASRHAFLRRHFMWIVAALFTVAAVLATMMLGDSTNTTAFPAGLRQTLVIGMWCSLAYVYLAAIVYSITGSSTVMRFLCGVYFVFLSTCTMWVITSS